MGIGMELGAAKVQERVSGKAEKGMREVEINFR
jgi:hypothetical protein